MAQLLDLFVKHRHSERHDSGDKDVHSLTSNQPFLPLQSTFSLSAGIRRLSHAAVSFLRKGLLGRSSEKTNRPSKVCAAE